MGAEQLPIQPARDLERWAGILLHPTSLPGRFGIGDLGPEAFRFVAWLERAGQTVWQVLPIGPTEVDHSPYTSPSAFAGNPLLISLQLLVQEGLLEPAQVEALPECAPGRVDFLAVERIKRPLLRRSFERFRARGDPARVAELESYCRAPEQAYWLDDWALFAAIRTAQGEGAWTDWPVELRQRRPAALARARRELADEIAYQSYLQFLFDRQWQALRTDARRRGVGLLGDLPIYLAADSADVWAHPELFALDADGRPAKVAGVPPDYFAADGQLWGNPLYRWDQLAATGYAWWVERLRTNLRRFDFVRLDHFRAFAAYWELPSSAKTAREGRWVPGPGRALFAALEGALGRLPLVAEDLGEITPEVDELRRALGLPGMKVLQFGFLPSSRDHLPHRLERRSVIYTGTHDNDTARGFFAGAGEETRALARDYLGVAADDFPAALIRAAYASVAELAIVPLQDALGLGTEARMNLPGVAGGNWSWRVSEGDCTDLIAARLRRWVEITDRLPTRPAPALLPETAAPGNESKPRQARSGPTRRDDE